MKAKNLILFCAMSFFACDGKLTEVLLEDNASAKGVLFVKSKEYGQVNSYPNPYEKNYSNIYRLTPLSSRGKLEQITFFDYAVIRDLAISPDAKKVLFSMKPRNGRYHIYEMNLDGSNLRKLTFGDHNNFDPEYLPDGRIVFTSDRTGERDEYERRPSETLHVMGANGESEYLERISFNLSDDFDPIVLKDGKIVYTRWEHHGPMNRFPLFSTFPDGTDTFLHYGSHSQNLWHVQELPDGRLAAIVSKNVLNDSGAVAIITPDIYRGDPDRGHSLKYITDPVAINHDKPTGAFRFISVADDTHLVVSYTRRYVESRNESEADYGLYLLNIETGELELLYNDPEYQEIEPVVIRTKEFNPMAAPTRTPNRNTARFLARSVYFRQANDGQDMTDKDSREIRYAVITQGIPTMSDDIDPISETNYERKRIIGFVPVEDDGSFAIEVPADLPFSFNIVNDNGETVVFKRTWIYGRPGENVDKCTGCHGDRGIHDGAPTIASIDSPTIVDPSNVSIDVSYCGFVKPQIQQKGCANAGCHDGTVAPNLQVGKTGSETFEQAYLNLLNYTKPPTSTYTKNAGSRYSALITALKDATHAGLAPDTDGSITLGTTSKPVDSTLRKWEYWIDLGGQYRMNQDLNCN
ncbi:MAG: hypothetical protein D6767_02525 [Candidatus Hydrogenedentota bacterium]|nr:MAG: hypothetical protein D6767_02525 [Candidatus Hydrogenedentota bacterium]